MNKKHFFVVDFETGGLDPSLHDPVQVAVMVLDSSTLLPLAQFSTYIQPEAERVTQDAFVVNKLSLDLLQDAPGKEEAFKALVEFLKPYGQGFFVAHNAKFDYDFFKAWARTSAPVGFDTDQQFDRRILCTAQMALQKLVLQERRVSSVRLGGLTEYFGIKHNAHDALGDVLATAELLKICLSYPLHKKIVRGIRAAIKDRSLAPFMQSVRSVF